MLGVVMSANRMGSLWSAVAHILEACQVDPAPNLSSQARTLVVSSSVKVNSYNADPPNTTHQKFHIFKVTGTHKWSRTYILLTVAYPG